MLLFVCFFTEDLILFLCEYILSSFLERQFFFLLVPEDVFLLSVKLLKQIVSEDILVLFVVFFFQT